MRERTVRNIGAPNVVRMSDRDVPQQVGVDLVTGSGPAETRLGVQRLQAHEAHKTLEAFAIQFEQYGHPARTEKRMLQMQFVDAPHEAEVLGGLRLRLVVEGRARQAEQRALLPDGQVCMSRIDASAQVLNGANQLFF